MRNVFRNMALSNRLSGLLRENARRLRLLLKNHEVRTALFAPDDTPPEGLRYEIGSTIRVKGADGSRRRLRITGVQSGGFSNVYTVLDLESMTPYCWRSARDLPDHPGQSEQEFRDESALWLRLGRHPNVVDLKEVFIHHGRAHQLIEFVSGSDLRSRVKQEKLPLPVAVDFAVQICRAMRHAARVLPGFVHGDLKPANCLLTNDGVMKLADFGRARVCATGETVDQIRAGGGGTLPYMPPEQFDSNAPMNARNDVYSFGVTLFELLTCNRPFHANDRNGYYLEHAMSSRRRPSEMNPQVPGVLDELVVECMACDPSQRYSDFAEVESALLIVAEQLSYPISPELAPPPPGALEEIKRADSLLELGEEEQAIAICDELLRQNPSCPRALSHKGRALLALNQPIEALLLFEASLDIDSQNIESLNGRGRALLALKSAEAALFSFDEALALAPRSITAALGGAEALLSIGRAKEAVRRLKLALSYEPEDAEALAMLSSAYVALRKYRSALTVANSALAVDRTAARAHLSVGLAMERNGTALAALESVKRAMQMEPRWQQPRKELARIYSSLRPGNKEAPEALQKLFDECEQTTPADVATACVDLLEATRFEPLTLFAVDEFIYGYLPEIDAATASRLVDGLSRLLIEFGETRRAPNVFYSAGKLFYGLDRIDECERAFRKSADVYGHDDKSAYYLATCAEIKKNFDLALEYYQLATTFDPECDLNRSGLRRMRAAASKRKESVEPTVTGGSVAQPTWV
jgi:serine/threonine protein kinase